MTWLIFLLWPFCTGLTKIDVKAECFELFSLITCYWIQPNHSCSTTWSQIANCWKGRNISMFCCFLSGDSCLCPDCWMYLIAVTKGTCSLFIALSCPPFKIRVLLFITIIIKMQPRWIILNNILYLNCSVISNSFLLAKNLFGFKMQIGTEWKIIFRLLALELNCNKFQGLHLLTKCALDCEFGGIPTGKLLTIFSWLWAIHLNGLGDRVEGFH